LLFTLVTESALARFLAVALFSDTWLSDRFRFLPTKVEFFFLDFVVVSGSLESLLSSFPFFLPFAF